MKSLFVAAVLTIAGAATAFGATSRAGVVTVDVDLSAQEKGKEVKLWLPYPVTDADQSITGISVSGDYAESGVYTDKANGTPILYARWNSDATSRKLSFAVAAERQEVVRRDFPKKETAWDPADYRQYLAPTSLGPIDGKVKKLADSITKGKKSVLEKARAIYDWTCDNTYRDPNTRGCGKGDVCALLPKPGGKCTDISSIFVALSRAAGVPSREIFGIRLGKKAEEDISTWQHCWAEFYLPGYGWVPVDPADVRKAMLVENLKLDDAKTKEYREYFWGGIDPWRIALAVGRDVILNPPQANAPLNTFGYPYAEVGGQAVDSYDPKNFRYTITFKER
ncbi:transglutaminase-like domain-containing protein [Geobacter benzoatilyticus]|uniref:Transglutaminase domain-containing protein n=1 Tax=Geobacter benzoatilyticus TaxID=2815309 RepID=A0ABX7Q0X0_9BACT|nr:transglutaminase domain-containing protein [Geobacter benzoatilyticus]QSV44710.1 transglutaminase domain-containing protein [Geobacter benzoatilyticus]